MNRITRRVALAMALVTIILVASIAIAQRSSSDQVSVIAASPVVHDPIAKVQAQSRTVHLAWEQAETKKYLDAVHATNVRRAQEAARRAAEAQRQREVALARDRAARSAATPRPATSAPVAVSGSHDWEMVAACESGARRNGTPIRGTANWSINTGNGYYGGLQETMWFWHRGGGDAYASRPDLASAAQQIAVAEKVLSLGASGSSQWPNCWRWA